VSTQQAPGLKRPELSAAKRALMEARLKGGPRAATTLVRRAHQGDIPLSFAQERLYFLDRMQRGSAAYNIDAGVRLPGEIDVAALERALGEVLRRHDALRTVFHEADGVPVQVVAPFSGFVLPVEDLAGLDEDAREAEVTRRATRAAAEPFDLAAGPLFRATLLRLGEREHVLLLCMHHIVSDGWSMSVMRRELLALYAAFRDGQPSSLPELPVQYADYAVWQREQTRGGAIERQLAYWKDRLAGAPELLELPTDHPRPAAPSLRGGTVPVALPAELLEGMRELARRENATLFMVGLAAFQVLLARYAGTADVVVGTPIAGRSHAEVQGLIGFFANTLALRTGLDGDPSLREVVARVRETVLGAYENQELPFERLVAEMQPGRSLGHSPLFQVMFTLETAGGPGDAPSAPGAAAVEAEHATAKFDLTLGLSAGPRGLSGALEYSTDLFRRETVERMAAHLARVLEQMAADPDARLSALRLMGPAERARVVDEWNRTEPAEPPHPCIHHGFEAQAARTPDAAAVVCGDDVLSYRALDGRANALAHHLVRLGVGPDVRVGVCLERGVEMVVAVLAVLKAGGAYVPLDPAYPAERIAYVLDDAGAAVVLTQARLRDRLGPDADLPVITVDGAHSADAEPRGDAPVTGLAPRNLAYVIYTSGSTGRPKGVAVEHAQAVRYLAWAARTYPSHSSAVHSSLSFDLTVTSLFLPLLSGGCVELVAEDAPVEALGERLERGGGYGMLKLTPAHLRVLGEQLRGRGTGGGAECLVVGGEPLIGEQLAWWKERLPDTVIVNEYGPTETVVGCCIHALPLARAGSGQLPIGRPTPGTRLYVLDDGGQPVPIGIPGELYVGGAQVTRGYLGRPRLTAERFVPDPFAPEPGARLYRTGDRVRWTEVREFTHSRTHALEYLGRLDEQVKVRGFRIEPGEIEAALRRVPGVADCAVVVREDVPGDRRLVAYVAGDVEGETLGAELRRTLPDYMVPAAFVAVDALPLTPNGKLDRRALPAPEYAARERYVAPRTPVEEVLAEVWAEVLGQERVGTRDSFFALGGHSLLAMRLVSRVRDAFGVELPLRALFEGPTVAELAVRVEEVRRAALPVAPPIRPADRAGVLPLSFAQERLWFLHRLQPESAFYNVPAAWRIAGGVDEPALERALGEVVRRHQALRTVFPESDGGPVQVVAPFAGFALPVEDLAGVDGDRREAELRRRVDEEAVRPFDLSAGPLFRPTLLRLGDRDHVLLLCMHHILSDEWSMGVLFRELSALYAAFREGGESPLAPLPVQYADYAVWQREQMRGEALERQMAYWRERLADAPALLELPTDRPRPAVQTYRGAREDVELPAAVLDGLRALGRGEGATLYMVLLAAFQVLLSKYGGGEDVVVGSPVSGRSRREVEELIGLFLNTLVLRTDLAGDPSFREVLRRVRGATLDAYEHQEIPFERLVEELQPGRSLSRSPLFQVLFVVQEPDRAGEGADADAGVRLRRMAAGGGTSKFDLTLSMAPRAGGLDGSIEYNTDLFDRATIRRMLAHLRRVLEQVAASAGVRLSALELLDDDERRQVVVGWNATHAAYPADGTCHALFEAQADRTPDAPAVVHAGGELTFAELDARANRLANRLVRLGVRADDRVGLCLERGPEMMAAVLAILKAGGAYVPLDPAYPADRLAYMLEDSGARVLVTQSALADSVPAGGAIVVKVDEEADDLARESAERPRVSVAADHLAYVIYTSGSTGRPKGVAMQHRPLVNLAAWQLGDWRGGPRAATLQFATISFDASFHEMFSAWLAGGRVVLIDEALRYDQAALLEHIERHGVERMFMPAVALQQLAEVADARGLVPARLREVQTAGEQLRVTEPMRRWFTALGAPVYNHYGPSETHVVTSLALAGDPAEWPLLPTIGTPIANTQCYVLDASLRPVPVGIPGELYLGGDNVARGYLGRPALTAERFVPDPFAAKPGARVYRTGDRARWLADGTIEFLGRTDEQVKIRGFRIEPGEVEAVLARHPAVREAVVVVREDAPGDRRLVAYVTAAEGAVPAPAELRAHLKGRLPEYMVPSAVVVLDAIPLTPSGKVARRALPAPSGPASGAEYVAPRTTTEEVVAEIYADVLRVERVGVEESFFDLGGHSLLATRVVSRIRDVLGVELPLRALFERPTVADAAAAVEALRRADAPVPPPVVPVDRTGRLPLSFAQERLWFLDRLQPGSIAYNLPAALRLQGPLDAGALERALGEVVRRHEALRTTFAEVDGAPVQVIAPFAGFALPVEELSGLEEGDRQAAATRRVEEDAMRPFDLQAGPLFRASLLRLGKEEHLLLLAMHHVVSDGWSMDVLSREVSVLYAAFRDGGASPLPELPVQYADFAVWQRRQLAGEALEAQLAYWRARLAGAPELLELPLDRPRPPAPSFRGGTVPVELPAAVLERLQALGRREGATLFMVLLGAFQALLARYGGGEDVVVGSPIAGRGRRETEALIGYFANTLVLRAELYGDPDFREVLRRVREATLGAYEHQDVPFERLVAELRPERSLSHSPLFQVAFTLNRPDGTGGAAPALRVSGADADVSAAKFDLALGLEPTADGLRGGLTYAQDLFDRDTAARMAAHLCRVLEQVADDAEVRLSRLALMAPAERAALVDGWRRAEPAAPADASLHARFADQARRAPGAVALVCEGRSMTYGELDARSDHLARHLVRLGVGPEARVAVCLERSPEMAVAILGVLRAGGAYVPVDPAYPPDRIDYLLRDSGVALVLAHDATRAAVPAGADARVLTLDALLAEPAPAAALPVPAAGNAAYVIYTSGSTGKPKGVVVTHANVLRLFQATDAWFGFGADDVWTLFHSCAFDFSVWEIWGALLYGGRLVVVPFGVSRDPAAFRALLAREGVTVLNQTPSAFRQLVHADASAEGELALRWVVFGGEALEPRALKPWFDRHGDRKPRLVNMYGITETTVHVTWRPVTAADAESPAGSMIGEGLPDLGVYLLDGRMEPVPPGVPGELFVGGAGVARGYLGRPSLTAQRFVPDPFSGIPGARMYRSGDLARVRKCAGASVREWNGEDVSREDVPTHALTHSRTHALEYLGRADQQVKIRGFRIEPGEVESALAAQPGVREALVLACEDEPGVRRLVAYVVADEEDADAAALRAALAARLPDYMVPAAFVRLDALPLTPHGKVDRRALPAPDGSGASAAAYVAPAGPVETALAAVWAEALGVERVGARDNYFALGGDSMRAIQLLALARARGIPFSLQDLFRHQTVAELAPCIQPEPAAEDAGAAPFALLGAEDRARVPAGVEDAYPMTQMQLGMLFHTESAPGGAVYHNAQTYRVQGRLDEGRLRDALAALARRHPILRTSFDLGTFSEPMQLVHARTEIPLVVESLADRDAEAREAALDAWLRAERRRPFDWRTAPLIRFHVHLLGEDAFQFGFAEHHAILDGWSVAAMQAELMRLYFDPAAALDEPPPAPALRDFAALERQVLASAEARAFWAEVLDDAVPVLPASRGGADGAGNRTRRAVLPARVGDALAELARGEGLPLKSVFLSAHLRVLALAGGTADVTTGVVVNGRPEGPDAERALGLFLNTVPFRVRLSGGRWVELARAAFRAEERMLPYRRFPAAELQRMRGGEPAFASLFNYVHFHVMDGAAAAGGERLGGARSAGGTNFPFGVSFEVGAGGVGLFMEYDAARYTDEDADVLIGRYLDVLARMAADPRARYDAELLSMEERAAVLAASAGPAADAVEAETLHGLFALQAARAPGAAALVCGGEALTYGELDARAARLARVLRARGVGPEARVAVCTRRSPEMVAGMLAVLRAGGACVPLDPAYPAERLAFILADAGVRLALADASTADALAGWGGATLLIGGAGEGAGAAPVDDGEPIVHPRAAAYVIYTSGSTGTPKGVVVEHGAAAAHVAPFARALGIGPADRVLHFAPAGFDVAIEQMFLPLAAGATLVLRDGEPWSPAEWAARVDALGITVANLVPAYWTEVAAASRGSALPGLRLLLVGADAMPAAAVHAWREAVDTPARLLNAYGPTEAVVTATVHDVAEGGAGDSIVPIGGALAGRAAYVLDPFGAPAASGVPGELYLGGALLARGYGGRPALTAERFVPDPFSAVPGARIYRTGDRVRVRECVSALVREWNDEDVSREATHALTHPRTHALEFLGRVDAQLKVRGFRVEPGEVEAALALHPAVRAAAVAARDDGDGRRLVAYVAAPGEAPSAAELRARLRARLPEHMVPSAFVVLDALPVTPSGKLDRRALPSPSVDADRGGDAFVAPRDALELRIARLWEEVLGTGAVGVRDDFFALGGHSLAALRLLASVEGATGRRVPMSVLLARPTVEGLAAALRDGDAPGSTGPLVPLQPRGEARPLFLVHAAGGGVASYAALARRLGPDQPVYALQSRGLEADEPVHETVEEMAADYLAELRAVQPAGPYRLGGWSMGGLVAFEMARMLHAAGEPVELLALIDSPVPGSLPSAEDEGELLAGFMLHLGMAPEQITRAAPEVAALDADGRLRRAWQAALDADLVPAGLAFPRFERLWGVYRANAAAASAYRPAPAGFGLLLVHAHDRPVPAADDAARWAAFTTGPVRSAAVPGDHFTLVREPHVGALAALLADAPAAGAHPHPVVPHASERTMQITDSQIHDYRRDGYLLLPALFSAEEVRAMKDELPGVFAQDTPARVMEKETGVVRSVYGSHRTHEVFARMVRDPRLLGAAQRILQDEVYVHQFKVNAKQAFRGEVWEWHQDYIFWRNEDGMPTANVVTVALFLDEVNEFNGPLLFVPGSQRGGVIEPRARKQTDDAEPSWKADVAAALSYTVQQDTLAELVAEGGIVAPKGPAGSVLFFHGNVVHGSAPNMSPFDRMLALVTYNAVSNAPRLREAPRPEFLCERDFTPVAPLEAEAAASKTELVPA
jgi:amino acid adenylation domain-containing protein